MERKDWTVLVVSLIVVAVLASVITTNLTGNVVRLNEDKRGRYEVYTKAEIDAKLGKETATYQGVLNMLGRCQEGWAAGDETCSDYCKRDSKTCVASLAVVKFNEDTSTNFVPCYDKLDKYIPGTQSSVAHLSCLCCSV